MGEVIEVGWFVDNSGRTYLGRVTPKARKIEIEKVMPQAEMVSCVSGWTAPRGRHYRSVVFR